VQRSATILGFVLLFGVLAALLVFARSREVERPTAAEAFFEKYQQRSPYGYYRSGHIEVELTSQGTTTTSSADFAFVDGELKATSTSLTPSGRGKDTATTGILKPGMYYIGAETRLPVRNIPLNAWSIEPQSIRFREDPRAKALGARQLIVEFPARQQNLTPLTQLLTIDAESYRLLFAESSWGLWDSQRRVWVYQQTRTLSHLNEPLQPESLR
jgi:hypothetical protein